MKGLGFEPRDREREKARGELIFQFYSKRVRGEHLGLAGKLLYSKKPEGSGLSEARRMENRVGMDRGNGG